MNDDELIDYVLGKLDDGAYARVELALEHDPARRARARCLREALDRLLDDGNWAEPPAGLATRTLVFVAKNRRRPLTFREYIPLRMPFRWADFAVAASIFVAGLLTLLPAIQRSRDRMNQAGCVFNLQQLGNSLAQYASLHPFLPYPPTHRGDIHTGAFAALLNDAGMLHDPSILDCPANGPCPTMHQLASFEQLDQIRHSDPDRYRGMCCWDYAYNVGYRHESGRPGPLEVAHSSQVPILADQPNHVNYLIILQGNSLNHGGLGQNVLFGDGSVRWLPSRRVSPVDLDLFLNNENEPRPGVHAFDSVLLPSKLPFHGQP
jgi:hypothetical protein